MDPFLAHPGRPRNLYPSDFFYSAGFDSILIQLLGITNPFLGIAVQLFGNSYSIFGNDHSVFGNDNSNSSKLLNPTENQDFNP